jgi:DNA-binding NarL/FixJ family response regulator
MPSCSGQLPPRPGAKPCSIRAQRPGFSPDRKDNADAFRELSDREMDVLAQVARGLGNAEIGEKLNLSEKTVRNYISTMFEKLSLSNRVELAVYAIEHHLFEKQGRE